jgi:hypothetical protein
MRWRPGWPFSRPKKNHKSDPGAKVVAQSKAVLTTEIAAHSAELEAFQNDIQEDIAAGIRLNQETIDTQRKALEAAVRRWQGEVSAATSDVNAILNHLGPPPDPLDHGFDPSVAPVAPIGVES